jgi:hypothetical protein
MVVAFGAGVPAHRHKVTRLNDKNVERPMARR